MGQRVWFLPQPGNVLLDSIGTLLQAVALATVCPQAVQLVPLGNIGMGQRALQTPPQTPITRIHQRAVLKPAEHGILQPTTAKCRQTALLVHRDNTGTVQLVLPLPPQIVLPDNIGMVHRALALPLPLVHLDSIGTVQPV